MQAKLYYLAKTNVEGNLSLEEGPFVSYQKAYTAKEYKKGKYNDIPPVLIISQTIEVEKE